jgi:hypothetical protein
VVELGNFSHSLGRKLLVGVVVNGQLMNYDFQFKSLVCNAYTGTLPPACLEFTAQAKPAKPTRC